MILMKITLDSVSQKLFTKLMIQMEINALNNSFFLDYSKILTPLKNYFEFYMFTKTEISVI